MRPTSAKSPGNQALKTGRANGARTGEARDAARAEDIRARFFAGAFPVATVDTLGASRAVETVLGLVTARGYDAEETFFSMLQRAWDRGARGIIGYRETVAFHPDGSRFYTCCGTAVTWRRA